MSLLQIVLLAVLATLYHVHDISTCASFGNTSVTIYKDNKATVTFTVNNRCIGKVNSVNLVKVVRGTTFPVIPICRIKFIDNKYGNVWGCSHDSATDTFSVTHQVDDKKVWLLIGYLNNSTFRQEVHIPRDASFSDATSTTTDPTVTSGVSLINVQTTYVETTTATTEVQEPSNNTALQTEDLRFFLLLGFMGFVLLVVVALFAVFGVVFNRKRRARRLPLPPAPHNVRRAAGHAVMFHAAQDGSDSFVSVHEYDEIPDDDNTASRENSQRSVRSSSSSTSSLSDSSMSDDCLHHIACPSSDSSLPDDYLNPVPSDWESCEDTFEITIVEDHPNENVNALPWVKVEP